MIKRKINELSFRLNLRKSIQEEPSELLKITYDEVIKELNRRNKKK